MKKLFMYKGAVALAAITPVLSYAETITSGNGATLSQVTVLDKDVSGVLGSRVLNEPDVTDLKSALDKEPGVEINSSGLFSSISMRGIGGDKALDFVELTIDGEPTHTTNDFSNNSGGKNAFEIDAIKDIEVMKGRKGPEQGSGALSGSINLQTYSPSDFVNKDKPYGFLFKSGYDSKNYSSGNTIAGAFQKGNLGTMLMVSHRKFKETGSRSDRQMPNNLRFVSKQQNILFKSELELEKGRLLFTGSNFERHTDNAESKLKSEEMKSQRLSLSSKFRNVFGMEHLDAKASWGKYKEDQFFAKNHQQQFSLKVDAQKTFTTANVDHNVSFGLGFNRKDYDIAYVDLMKYFRSGRTLVEMSRYQPNIKRNLYSVYVKNSMDFGNGLTLTPGVRVERHDVDFIPYKGEGSKFAPKDFSDTVVTPSIAFSYSLSGANKVFGSYAKGEKLAYENNASSWVNRTYQVIPNPDLKNEKSDNFELGFSHTDDRWSMKIVGFYNKYKNQILTTPIGRINGKTTYLPINSESSKSYGVELTSALKINENFSATAGLSMLKAKDKNGDYLETSTPHTLKLGIGYKDEDVWGANLSVKLVRKAPPRTVKSRRAPPSAAFRAPGYGVTDLTMWWKPAKNMKVSGGVYNVFDKQYWHSSDVAGSKASDVNSSSTQPGRNFAVNFNYEF